MSSPRLFYAISTIHPFASAAPRSSSGSAGIWKRNQRPRKHNPAPSPARGRSKTAKKIPKTILFGVFIFFSLRSQFRSAPSPPPPSPGGEEDEPPVPRLEEAELAVGEWVTSCSVSCVCKLDGLEKRRATQTIRWVRGFSFSLDRLPTFGHAFASLGYGERKNVRGRFFPQVDLARREEKKKKIARRRR